MDWLGWLGKYWATIGGFVTKELGTILAGAVIVFLSVLGAAIVRRIKWLIEYHRRLLRVQKDVGREKSGAWPKEGKGLWRARPIHVPDLKHSSGLSPKVLVVANAKGGVGKTTIAANIAACLSERAAASGEKPILLIDLDFQGTLSAMALSGDTAWLPESDRDSDASYLVSGDWQPNDIAKIDKAASSIGHTQNPANAQPRLHHTLRLITSYYDLAQAENRLMVEWLIGDRKEDIRFRLRELLWSDAVVNRYSAVVIDCPPRFTTAAIQAFAAATQFLIPTKLDQPSREAVLSFIQQIEILRDENICWDNATYAGVVATMVDPRANVSDLRQELNDKLAMSIDDGGAGGKAVCLDQEMDIHEKVVFRDAGGRGIAYFGMGNGENVARVKPAIQRLTHHVAREMRLPYNLQEGRSL